MSPLFLGLLQKAIFDRVAGGRAATHSALSLLAVLAAVELVRCGVLFSAVIAWQRWWATVNGWISGNLLRAVLRGGGPPAARLPGSPGEAVGRFRDDVRDLVWLADGWVDMAGDVVLAIAGIAIMVSIDPVLTVAVVAPLVGLVFVTRYLGHRVRRIHRGLRQSGAAVTAFVADMFTSAQTLKTSGAEDRAIARFRALNATRGAAAVRAQVTTSFISTVGGGVSTLSTGLILLLGAAAMRRGSFTVGDLALFTTFATFSMLPRRTGEAIARARAAGVSTARLVHFVPEAGVDGVFAPRAVDVTTPLPPVAAVPRDPSDALRRLTLRGVTASPAPGRRGIVGVDLDVHAGEFVVVTGAIGAGKTTLLRALLGLIPVDEGTIAWNDEVVGDAGLELVPPRVAYVAQVPRLFSAALDENVSLGWVAPRDEFTDAIQRACLDGDVADMPEGFATRVGPRGMRLSGGQAQRAAAARALVRRPDLLVVDDLSSALDPQTESRLWDGLASLPTAVLAVSHRPAVLARADRVVTLREGRVQSVSPR
jgi:ATP-binding cassette subfamily B protein